MGRGLLGLGSVVVKVFKGAVGSFSPEPGALVVTQNSGNDPIHLVGSDIFVMKRGWAPRLRAKRAWKAKSKIRARNNGFRQLATS